MELSWSAVYAIWAMHYLARNPDRTVSTLEIAKQGSIPPAFLANIFRNLRRGGLVQACRGRGYRLSRPASRLSIFDILSAVDGAQSFPAECAMKNLECGARDGCTLAGAWEGIHRYISDVLDSVTLDRLPTLRNRPICRMERDIV